MDKKPNITHETGLIEELKFWDNWFASKGSKWPQDYNDRMDPLLPLQSDLSDYVNRIKSQHVSILDVGAGPLTKLGKTHPSKEISITPTDLLAHQFDMLLQKYGINPIIRTQFVDAEALSECFGYNIFEIVHAQNCLDHMVDPLKAIQEMISVTKSGGFVLLKHNECEGANQGYHGLHQWDFYLHENQFIASHLGQQTTNISAMLRCVGEVDCKKEDSSVIIAVQKHSNLEAM